MTPFDEANVKRAVRESLEHRKWVRHWHPVGRNIDLYARRELAGEEWLLLLEAKGDVGPYVNNPLGQRLKYIQHALGQLIARTGPREYGYGPRTLLAAAFPSVCRDGSAYFRDTIRAKVSDDLRGILRLCLFFFEEDGSVTDDIPSSVPHELFSRVV